MELLIFLIWGGLGFAGMKIMENKNQSKGAGFAYGILLGILGIIICLCYKDKS